MTEVKLIDFTGKGRPDETWHAAHLLMFTKATRLEMAEEVMDHIQDQPLKEKMKQLHYMATTIRSSWEFVDLTFLISGVSRAAAQQITRTRSASYAMQSQRVVDASEARVVNPLPKRHELHGAFEEAASAALGSYRDLISQGASKQDARGVLPMNITTNLVAKYNLRAFADLIAARSSLRTQGEYAEVVRQMKEEALKAWPWAEPFFSPRRQKAIEELERIASEQGLTAGEGLGWRLAKVADLLRGEL